MKTNMTSPLFAAAAVLAGVLTLAAPSAGAEENAAAPAPDPLAFSALGMQMSSQIDGNIAAMRSLRDLIGYGRYPLGVYAVPNTGSLWRVAVQSTMSTADTDGAAGLSGFERMAFGGTLMAEYADLRNGRAAGLSVGYEHARTETDTAAIDWESDDVRINGHLLFSSKTWQSRTILGVGLHEYDMHRREDACGLGASPNGVSVNLMQEIARRARLSSTRFVENFLRMESSYNTIGSFSEHGGDAAIAVGSQHAWATDITFGSRFTLLFAVNRIKNPGVFTVEGGIVKSIGDEAANVSARRVHDGASFRIGNAERERWGALLGSSVSMPLSGRSSLNFAAHVQCRDSSFESNMNAAFHLAF